MLAWLRGPGTAAPESEFAARLRAYRVIFEAVSYLPRGPALLRRAGAMLPAPRVQPAMLTRSADSFTLDELVLLGEPVLSPQGWVVPAPLVPHVERVRAELEGKGLPCGDQHAAAEIIRRAAVSRGRSALGAMRALGKVKTKMSRERRKAIAARTPKVPPPESGV